MLFLLLLLFLPFCYCCNFYIPAFLAVLVVTAFPDVTALLAVLAVTALLVVYDVTAVPVTADFVVAVLLGVRDFTAIFAVYREASTV